MTNPKTKNVSQLEDHVGYWLRTVSNQISGSFKKKLEAKKTTVAEWVVLRLLYYGGASPGSIAEKAGMTRGAITKIVDKLLAKGWVTRTESKHDRRSQHLELTQKGKSFVPELAKIADENDSYYFAILSAKQQDELRCLLQEMANLHQMKKIPVD